MILMAWTLAAYLVISEVIVFGLASAEDHDSQMFEIVNPQNQRGIGSYEEDDLRYLYEYLKNKYEPDF